MSAIARSDVLDTWFSSALWPFATLGWPDDNPPPFGVTVDRTRAWFDNARHERDLGAGRMGPIAELALPSTTPTTC